jgi:signal peptidase II
MPDPMTRTAKTTVARNNHRVWYGLSLIVLVLDQATKYWAEHILRDGVVPIFFWFDLSLVHNTGAAFGFLNRAGGWQHVFFVALAIGISIALVWMIRSLEPHQRHLAIAYSLIIGGALGNAIDRVVYQYVVDFIHWFYKDWHYPHFNLADAAIFLGAALLITEAFGKPFLDKQEQSE